MRCCYFNYLNPYNSCQHLWASRFLARLLEAEPAVTGLMGPNPYGEDVWAASEARTIRIAAYWCRWYTPTEAAQQRATADAWLLRNRMGTRLAFSWRQLKATFARS